MNWNLGHAFGMVLMHALCCADMPEWFDFFVLKKQSARIEIPVLYQRSNVNVECISLYKNSHVMIHQFIILM